MNLRSHLAEWSRKFPYSSMDRNTKVTWQASSRIEIISLAIIVPVESNIFITHVKRINYSFTHVLHLTLIKCTWFFLPQHWIHLIFFMLNAAWKVCLFFYLSSLKRKIFFQFFSFSFLEIQLNFIPSSMDIKLIIMDRNIVK